MRIFFHKLALLFCFFVTVQAVAVYGVTNVPVRLEMDTVQKPVVQVRTAIKKLKSASTRGAVVADWVYLPAPGQKELGEHSEEKAGRRIGIVRELPVTAGLSGVRSDGWQTLSDGSKVYTLAIQSGAAVGLRLQLTNTRLPDGAFIIVVNAINPDEYVGPYTARDLHEGSTLWTETVFSELVYLECHVPAGAAVESVTFSVKELGHVYEPFEKWSLAKVGTCHNDVNCADSAWQTAANGVAGVGSISAGGLIWCTGALLNNSLTNFADYFLTAQHCVGNQVSADSTEYYWFYQTTACGGTAPSPASVPRTGGGAVLLASRSRAAGSDFSFMRLRQASPGGVSHLGWSVSPVAVGSSVRSIHHPDNSYKRISYGSINAMIGNFIRVIWSAGTTESGGSGAPLFNASRQVVGQLWGGTASCGNMNGYDDFGRFDVTYPMIMSWLSPTAPVANDNFTNATVMIGSVGQSVTRNDIATREAGEPNHAGRTGGNSVWWKWTVPSNGVVTISTYGSNFDTLMSIYTGASLTHLKAIISSDDEWDVKQSRVTFAVTEGTEYWVAVDGYRGAFGNVVLNWILHETNRVVTKSVVNDYSGNGRSDLIAYDPAGARWYTKGVNGPIITWADQWGYPNAIPVPGDYNGDGRWDQAIFDPPFGLWYVKNVHGNPFAWNYQWGWSTAKPVPGDYNGDGRWDQAVFDTVGGFWYIKSLLGGQVLTWKNQWGWSTAKPVPGDYNGNGSYDLAVYDSVGGFWYVKTLANQLIEWKRQWGWSGAITVPGDYDGDGRSDFAVFNPLDGSWYILGATGNVIAWKVQWGWNGALPVAGDYNGDGLADLAVVDSQTGRWYIRNVSGSTITWANQWGWKGARIPRLGE